MHSSLSRIEREYIIQSLREDLPRLTILGNGDSCTVDQYRCNGTTIEWDTKSVSSGKSSWPARVFFTHKKKTMSFSTSVVSEGNSCSCSIAGEIYPDKKALTHMEDCMVFPDIPGTRYAVFPVAVQRISRDRAASAEYPSAMQALAARVGITPEGRYAVPVLARYLDGIRKGTISVPSEEDAGHIVFADHQRFLVSLPASCSQHFLSQGLFSVHIQFRQRLIHAGARCTGILKVNENIVTVAAEFGTLQEEDKRFLFEHQYTEKYTGIV